MLAGGWAIVWGPKSTKPGWVEMDYFHTKEFHGPPDYTADRLLCNPVITPEEWCKLHRPYCKFVRVQVVEVN